MPSFNNRMIENYKVNGKLFLEEHMKKHHAALANVQPLIDTSPPKSRTKYFTTHKDKQLKAKRISGGARVSFVTEDNVKSPKNHNSRLAKSRSMSLRPMSAKTKSAHQELLAKIKDIQSGQKVSVAMDTYDLEELCVCILMT